MAVARFNVALRSIRGKCGDILIRKYGDKFVIGPLPDYSSRRRSRRQKASSRTFGQAVKYAGEVKHDPVRRAAYARRKPRRFKTLRGFIIADYLKCGPA